MNPIPASSMVFPGSSKIRLSSLNPYNGIYCRIHQTSPRGDEIDVGGTLQNDAKASLGTRVYFYIPGITAPCYVTTEDGEIEIFPQGMASPVAEPNVPGKLRVIKEFVEIEGFNYIEQKLSRLQIGHSYRVIDESYNDIRIYTGELSTITDQNLVFTLSTGEKRTLEIDEFTYANIRRIHRVKVEK